MTVSETEQHRRLKQIICNSLSMQIGASIKEYPSSGHELDVLAVTPDGVSIYVEIIWSDSRTHFLKDLNMLHESDADVKVAVVSPSILAKEEYKRDFLKAVIAQRRAGRLILDDFVDGKKVLETPGYFEGQVIPHIVQLIAQLRESKKMPQTWLRAQGIRVEIPKPAEVEEELLSNLLPVLALPEDVWSTATKVRDAYDIFVRAGRSVAIPPFVLKNRRLYTFAPLDDEANQTLVSIFGPLNELQCENVKDWRTQLDKRNLLVQLLNLALKDYCKRELGLRYDRRRDRFIFGGDNSTDRVVKWKPGARIASRKVVKCLYDVAGRPKFWRHYSAECKFLTIGEELFLLLQPGLTFTKDGRTPLESTNISRLSTRWMHNQYNSSYLYYFRFWAAQLSKQGDAISITTGGPRMEVSVEPATCEMRVGLPDDSISVDRMFERVPELFEEPVGEIGLTYPSEDELQEFSEEEA